MSEYTNVRYNLARWLPYPYAGITINNRIYLRKAWWDNVSYYVKRQTLAHEIVHVDQWRAYGIIGFPIRYIIGWVKAGFSYTRNRWEVEARFLSVGTHYINAAEALLTKQGI